MALNIKPRVSQTIVSFVLLLILMQCVASHAQATVGIYKRKYIDVCPLGQTTSCKKIGITDVGPTPAPENPDRKFESGKDVVAPAVTTSPSKPIDGETKVYTSYSESTTNGARIFFPVVVPIPVGEPIPPILPEDSPPPVDTPEEPDTSARPKSSSESQDAGQYCTKPTPQPQKPAATPVSAGNADNPFADPPASTPTPECDHSGSATKGFDPETLLRLVDKFCKDGMASTKTTLDIKALEPEKDPDGVAVEFEYSEHGGNCPVSCKDAYKDMMHSCQFNSHMIIGSGSLLQNCGDYYFNIKVDDAPKPEEQKPSLPGFPTITSGSTCFSGTPQGQKSIHDARASDLASQACDGLAADLSAGIDVKRPYLIFSGFDIPDKDAQADLKTDVKLYAKATKDGLIVPGGDDCKEGFKKAIANCPGNDKGFFGGSINHKDIQYSVYGTESLPARHKRGIPTPREMRMYAYAACPEAYNCEQGYAIADHYAFSPSSVCDYGGQEIMFHAFDADGTRLDTRFKTFGHKGCTVRPNGDITRDDADSQWGVLDCGSGLGGNCTVLDKADMEPLLCPAEESRKGTTAGKVMQMVTICRF